MTNTTMLQCQELNEYVCTLQPPVSSALARALADGRRRCREAGLGLDTTDLYPPHVTVTGFFTATQQQAAEVCALASRELAACIPGCSAGAAREAGSALEPSVAEWEVEAATVALSQVLATEGGGYVLIDVAAPAVAALAAALAEKAPSLGVHLRPKAVRHLSLASGRTPDEQTRIRCIYQALPSIRGAGAWDFVISRLIERSNVERLEKYGLAHKFEEVLRVPLQTAETERGGGPLVCKPRPIVAAEPSSPSVPRRPVARRRPRRLPQQAAADLSEGPEAAGRCVAALGAGAAPAVGGGSSTMVTPLKRRCSAEDDGITPQKFARTPHPRAHSAVEVSSLVPAPTVEAK